MLSGESTTRGEGAGRSRDGGRRLDRDLSGRPERPAEPGASGRPAVGPEPGARRPAGARRTPSGGVAVAGGLRRPARPAPYDDDRRRADRDEDRRVDYDGDPPRRRVDRDDGPPRRRVDRDEDRRVDYDGDPPRRRVDRDDGPPGRRSRDPRRRVARDDDQYYDDPRSDDASRYDEGPGRDDDYGHNASLDRPYDDDVPYDDDSPDHDADDGADDGAVPDLAAGRRAAARRAAARRTERATATAARLSRQRRSGVVVAISVVVVVVVGYDLLRAPAAEQRRATARVPVAGASPTNPAVTGPSTDSTHQAEKGPTSAPSGSVPRRGAGTFTVASGRTDVVGRGTVLRYKVEVEEGSGQDATAFAAEVDATLANSRSWTAGGRWGFQRVSYGPPDFVIQLATPDTTDRICGAGGLETRGYTSCRTGSSVVINLARWLLAVPEFEGDVATYRLYVVNHEVGHRLGRGHMACPGPGRLAPVMQQQTLGLRGCQANPWPYVDGKLVTGPSAP